MSSQLLSVFAISALLISGCSTPVTQSGRESLSDLLKSYAFEDVSPPSRIPSPGTIIRINSVQPLNYNVVCSASEAFGNEWASQVISSDTIDTNTKNKIEQKFSVGADYKGLLSASASAEKINDIKMQLSNTKLLLITSASARSGVADQNCLDASRFKGQQAAGEITMITSALQADVEYMVEFKQDASLSSDTKQELLKQLTAKLGGSATNEASGTVKGTKLFWGVKRDRTVFDQYIDAHH